MASRKLLGAVAVAASVAGGGVAGALLGTPSPSAAQESDSPTTTSEESDSLRSGPGFGGCHAGGHVDLAVAAEVLGMTEEELRDAVDEDTSIADVAAEQGVDVQAVIDALVADATADIDAAVADGDLDAERAADLKAGLAERVTAVVNGDFPVRGPGGFRGGPGRRFIDLAVAADVLATTEEELRDAIGPDMSIADVAAEQGVDVQGVIDALVADATAHIDAAVADGDLDAERAADLKAGLVERVTALVNGELPERGPGPGGFRGGS